MKIKIIIFKLIIIDLFIQGPFAARLIFLCFLVLPQHQWDDLKPYAKDMNIERKGNLIIIWWEVKSTYNTLWSHQKCKNLYLFILTWPKAWKGNWIVTDGIMKLKLFKEYILKSLKQLYHHTCFIFAISSYHIIIYNLLQNLYLYCISSNPKLWIWF